MPFSALKKGWHYFFSQRPQQRDDSAQRAAFLQFQTYPDNTVQGRGTLRAQYFAAYDAPLVRVGTRPVQTDLTHGGTVAGSIVSQSLVDTSQSQG